MNEEFKNYLHEHLVIGGCGIKAEEPVQDENAEVSASTTTNEPVAETTKPTEEQPKLATNENGSYQCFVLTPSSHREKIEKALTEMAKTDEELAKAIAEGKKTFEGCDRFVRNNMQDLMRELKLNGACAMDDDTIHSLARWYMVNADVTDVKSAIKTATTKPKAEKKKKETKKAEPKKAESKPKAEPKKEEKKAEVVDMFADFFKEED